MPQAKTQKSQADELREQHPNAWIAVEEGDTLIGVVEEVTRAWSDARNRGSGDGWYPLLQVRTDDGPVLAFHAFTEVSYSRVVELQPLPGERIVVSFNGLGKAKEGQNAPKLFTVRLPDRDPRETARRVYGAFSSSPRALPPTPAAQANGGDAEPEQFDF